MSKRQREGDDFEDYDQTEEAAIVRLPTNPQPIICTLPPQCSITPHMFLDERSFESHYLSEHSNVCSECHKNFPNEHLLNLHIDENHNPILKIQLEQGLAVFHCFVPGCDKVCSTHKKRRLHLVDKHGYPKDFIFSIVDTGIKPGQNSLIKRYTRIDPD
ncbi:hypothetical protein CANARDRAFT_27670 [[Candida] arabinofermentans NRRL YB-2248]|uniref:C2H2-type domain-containing protein n=1 Tax=[Candida] arabinofermentans NRRL YB-2248 TaxID=983967 RepID=A0A1E4T3X5_9ASCO|nr:hypothetical protein CANARDRAFT_27670 [[Candida] arabinofermentans NRRL YB-2248]